MSKYAAFYAKKSVASRYYHPILLLPTRCTHVAHREESRSYHGATSEVSQSYLKVTY